MRIEYKKDRYARDTLERYTGSSVEEFGSQVILVNFPAYVEHFASVRNAEIKSGYWSAAHDRHHDVSIINFGVGSPSAGIITHCLSFLEHVACVLMVGMCGGIDDALNIGDIVIPTASVRDEGTSRHYLPQDVPALPSFAVNRISERVIISTTGKNPKSGIMMTTDYRMWEFDEEFVDYILKHRIIAVDMEIATIFSVAYALNLPVGAIMLVSDLPLQTGGIKNKDSAREVFAAYTREHITLALEVMEEVKKHRDTLQSCRTKCEW